MTAREEKRAARAWARAERDALDGKADAGYMAALRPRDQAKEQERTKEGGSSG